MSRYVVICNDGREFRGVHANSAEDAKQRVFCWTWGRCPKSEMTVRPE